MLAEVSHAFATVAFDYHSLLTKVARTVADLVGDGCLVTLLEGDFLVNAANAHVVPAIEAAYREYVAKVPVAKSTSPSVAATVLRTGMPNLTPVIEPGAMAAQVEPELRPIVRELDVRSFAVVPIRVRGDVIGTLSIFRSGSGRSYNATDVVLLGDLADRAGLAIDNARLYLDLERRVRERTRELEQANRELEAFSYSVAHDLRAPLRSIDGFSHALLEDYGDKLDEAGQRYLTRIRAGAQNMAVLIDGLLALAHVGRMELRRATVSLSELAQAIVEQLREAEPKRQIEVAIAPALEATADPRLAAVILQNLIGNAWKFTSKREQAHLVIDRLGDAFFVRDDGVGFDPATASKLYSGFQRLHNSAEFPGNGIGLATVHRAVERHGGRIWSEAAVDRGATFYFTLAA